MKKKQIVVIKFMKFTLIYLATWFKTVNAKCIADAY